MRALVVLVLLLVPLVSAQSIMEILTTFIDLDGVENATQSVLALARQAFAEEREAKTANATFVAVDDAYPLASAEMDALYKLHALCSTPQALALETWCTGNATYLTRDAHNTSEREVLCPTGVRTHPCSGRVLLANRTLDDPGEFLWPWDGVKCNAYSEPTTVTHVYVSHSLDHLSSGSRTCNSNAQVSTE